MAIDIKDGRPLVLKPGFVRNQNYLTEGVPEFNQVDDWGVSTPYYGDRDSAYRDANYSELAAEGMWDLTAPDSPAFARFFGNTGGEQFPFGDDRRLEQLAQMLMDARIPDDQWPQALKGLDQATIERLAQHMRGQIDVLRKPHSGDIFDVIEPFVINPGVLASVLFPAGAMSQLVGSLSELTGLGAGLLKPALGIGAGMLQGGSLGDSLKGLAVGEGIGAAAEAAAPAVSAAVDTASQGMKDFFASLGDGVDEVGLSAYDLDELFADVTPPPADDFLNRRVQVADLGDDFGPLFSQADTFTGLSPEDAQTIGEIGAQRSRISATISGCCSAKQIHLPASVMLTQRLLPGSVQKTRKLSAKSERKRPRGNYSD